MLAVSLLSPLLRPRYNRWGAADDEVTAPLPGDELVAAPALGYTRAITIDAPVPDVWPWLAQIGHGRGGLYSYDGLEKLVGCRMHSADAVLPEHQGLRPGDVVRLGPDGYPSFRVHEVEPPTTLVLLSAGSVPTSRPGATGVEEPVVTWQWVLRPTDEGRGTRLLVRQRLRCLPSQRLVWRIVEPIGFVMERRMLRSLAQRAERGARSAQDRSGGLPATVRARRARHRRGAAGTTRTDR